MSRRFVEWMPVAGWEIKRMLLRKDFVISTLLIPLIFVGIGFFMAWTRTRDQKQATRIAVVRLDPGGVATGDSLPPLEGITWTMPVGDAARADDLVAAIRAKAIEGAVVIPADYATSGEIEYVVRREHPGWKGRVEGHLVTLARLERAAGRGVSAAEFTDLTAKLASRERVAEPRSGTARGDRIAAMVMALFLATAIFGTNMYLAIGISGEKAARVTEVIVSAIRPQSWMDGKVAAYTVIGLVQAAVWAVTMLGVTLFLATTMPPAINPAVLGLTLLFAMMILNTNLRRAGFFQLVAERVIHHAHTTRQLLALVVVASGALSALFLNDTIVLTFTPLVLDICIALKRRPVPYLIALVIFFALFAVGAVILHRAAVGRVLYVIGDNAEVARYSGVDVARTRLVLFTTSSLVAGLARILFAARLGTVRGDMATGFELEIITIVLLGGVSIFGGSGRMSGVLLAASLASAMIW